MLGFAERFLCIPSNSLSAWARVRVMGPLPFSRTCDSGSLLILKSLCLSKMCKHRTLSALCSVRAFFEGGSSSFSSLTSKTPRTELARHRARGAFSFACASAASCVMTSEAVFGCLGKLRILAKISLSPKTPMELLSNARWCVPGWSSCIVSTCGAAEAMSRGRLRSRRPRARETGTASVLTPSLGGGADSASKASSMICPARAASGCARRPSAKSPSFPKVFFISSAFLSTSSGSATSSMPSTTLAHARGITALSTPPAASRSLCSSAVAFASDSHRASIRSTAASTLAKASLACSFRPSGALSGCTFKANLL
mmetsp:Transcript_129783/g.323445  ORF Transcript_129783/g.323445 Transcript_129783/m.323445 type:complete len:314 (-) Transcript_129783:1142-2083(-)